MQPVKILFLACVIFLFGSIQGLAQGAVAPGTALCNFFYVTSDNQEVLPFDDDCFIQENITLESLNMVREKGPISTQVDLFREYPWSFRIHLPEIDHDQRIFVSVPTALAAREHQMELGEFFLTISDNRERRQYGKNTDEVDFVAVSGKARITEYIAPAEEGAHAEFNVQIDVNVKKVERTPSGSARIAGDPVRLKGVLKIENK